MATGMCFALDALYATEFKPDPGADLRFFRDGRCYPPLPAVIETFAAHGMTLTLRHVQLFDCHRAEWHDAQGQPRGAVVGQTAEEAAVYALSLLRRQFVPVSTV